MQPRAACRSREHSYLVALRDGCCDNGDRLVVANRSHALRNICQRGERSGSREAARCSRGRSCLVVFRDGRCDNDDATFDSSPLSYIGGCTSVMGEVNAAAGRLSFERAQVLGHAPRRVL